MAINLQRATDRWAALTDRCAELGVDVTRIPAVDGAALQLPVDGYTEAGYRQRHGRTTNLREVGCYLSHLRAYETFLNSGEEHALILEDDVVLKEGFSELVTSVLQDSTRWDIARLSGLSAGHPVRLKHVYGVFFMCIALGRLKGTGAYLLNRKAARRMVSKLRPMKLPFDHAIDREWFYGLKAVCIQPFPVSQTESGFKTSIHRGPSRKLSGARRFVTTYPYQAANELSRWLFRAVAFAWQKWAFAAVPT